MRVSTYLLTALVLLLVIGCAGHDSVPVLPQDQATTDAMSGGQSHESIPENRYILGLWVGTVNEDRTQVVITPLRGAEFHLNATNILEGGMCADCLEISNLHAPFPGELWLDLTIRHPYDDGLNLTIFDPRAIFISGGDYDFIELGRTTAWGEDVPVLLNPDGFTQLFNPTEYPEDSSLPPTLKYWTGQFATGGDLSATLNPYIAYASDEPRRMFLPGSEETLTVKLALPSGPLQFGYAVDVCWTDPGGPVTDPEIDFPPDANSLEPYMVEVNLCEPLTSEQGDESCVHVLVSDHQGQLTLGPVMLEAPDLFSGTVICSYFTQIDEDTFDYAGQITNEFGAEPGTYPMLVKSYSIVDDPNLGEVNAWFVTKVDIVPAGSLHPVAVADLYPAAQFMDQPVHFFDDGSYDPDGGEIVLYEWDWDSDGTFDEEGQDVYHSWPLTGNYEVNFRVTDDEGMTDELDEPLSVYVYDGEIDFSSLTPPWLNYTPRLNITEGDCYAVTSGFFLHFYDISDPLNPVWITRIDDLKMYHVNHLASKDGYIYIAQEDIDNPRLSIVDVDPVQETHLVGSVDISCGYPLSVTIKDNYAWVGCTGSGSAGHAISFVDITDPESAFEAGYVNLMVLPHNIAFENGYTYVGDNGEGTGISVYDITIPDQIEYLHTFHVGSAHDLIVDNGYTFFFNVYAQIIDITPPDSYVEINEMASFYGWDFEVRDGYLYGTASIDDVGGWVVYDIDPPEDAFVVAQIPDLIGFNTTLTDGYAFVTDQGIATHINDITPPETSETAAFIYSLDGKLTDLAIDGDTVLVSRDESSFWPITIHKPGNIISVSNNDPQTAQILDVLNVESGPDVITIHNGYLLAAGNEKFYVVDISNAEMLSIASEIPIEGDPSDIAIDGSYAYITTSSGLVSIDISSPVSPVLTGLLPLTHTPLHLEVQDGFAYMLTHIDTHQTGLDIADISDPALMTYVDTVILNGHIGMFSPYYYETGGCLATIDQYMYAITRAQSGEYNFLNIMRISDPGSVEVVDTLTLNSGNLHDIIIEGPIAYIIGLDQLLKLDLTNAESPVITNISEDIRGTRVRKENSRLYVLGSGLETFDLL